TVIDTSPVLPALSGAAVRPDTTRSTPGGEVGGGVVGGGPVGGGEVGGGEVGGAVVIPEDAVLPEVTGGGVGGAVAAGGVGLSVFTGGSVVAAVESTTGTTAPVVAVVSAGLVSAPAVAPVPPVRSACKG